MHLEYTIPNTYRRPDILFFPNAPFSADALTNPGRYGLVYDVKPWNENLERAQSNIERYATLLNMNASALSGAVRDPRVVPPNLPYDWTGVHWQPAGWDTSIPLMDHYYYIPYPYIQGYQLELVRPSEAPSVILYRTLVGQEARQAEQFEHFRKTWWIWWQLPYLYDCIPGSGPAPVPAPEHVPVSP